MKVRNWRRGGRRFRGFSCGVSRVRLNWVKLDLIELSIEIHLPNTRQLKSVFGSLISGLRASLKSWRGEEDGRV